MEQRTHMAKTLKPLFAFVLLQRPLLESVHLSIPKSAAKRLAPPEGTVIAKGPAASPDIRIGSKVIYGRLAGDWLKIDDEHEVYVCQDEDILAEWVEE